ncbi:MAG: acyl carrier protein [Candidatus Sulfotelmatobacter sp.]
MDDKEMRLVECFLAVFPELTDYEIRNACSTSVRGWDSAAVVTLLAVIEEAFGISIEVDDPARFDSFKGILDYLREAENDSQGSNDKPMVSLIMPDEGV